MTRGKPADVTAAGDVSSRARSLEVQEIPDNFEELRLDAFRLAREGRQRENRGDLDGALDAFAAAACQDSTTARWHVDVGRVLAKQRRQPEAALAFRRAIDCDGRHAPAHIGFGRAARALVREQRTPDAERLLDVAFQLAHGPLALERFLAQRFGAGAANLEVESRPILSGLSCAHLIEHELHDRRRAISERVIQKVPLRRRELSVLGRLREVQDRPLTVVSFPKVLAIHNVEAVPHVFLERVAFSEGDTSYPKNQLDRVGAIYAGIARLLPLELAHEIGEHPDYSEEGLQATVASIRISKGFQTIRDRDPSPADDLSALEVATAAVADAACSCPYVFSHNDVNPSNIRFVRDEAGRVESAMLLDWGAAGPNLVGADLAQLCMRGKLSDDEFELVVDHYHRSLESEFPGLERGHVEFGAALYSVVRLSWLCDHPRPRTRVTQTPQLLRMCRIAAEQARAAQ